MRTLKGLPIIDELTGLYNRQWIEEKINRFLRRYVFDKQPSCLMMLEIDQFRKLGNRYGQLGSELVLREAAHTMLSCLRPNDQAGHFSGEKFVVFMPGTTLADGCVGAERLRMAINESMIVLPTGDTLPPISVSLGISTARLDDTPASLLARANEALQQAVESGGNCVKWPDKDMKHETEQPSAETATVLPVKLFMSPRTGAQPKKQESPRPADEP